MKTEKEYLLQDINYLCVIDQNVQQIFVVHHTQYNNRNRKTHQKYLDYFFRMLMLVYSC